MAFGHGRWLSGSRGLWETLTVAVERDLAVIMLQAPPVGPEVVDHLFGLVPATALDGVRRQVVVELDDDRDLHLSEKVIARRAVLARLRLTLDLARLADRLGIALVDAAPELLVWGTKAGSRRVFRAAGVPHPPGSYRLDRTVPALAATLDHLGDRFGRGQWMVKINDGFGSGHGNAIVDTGPLPAPTDAETLVRALTPSTPVDTYLRAVAATGAVVEQVVTGDRPGAARYPSALAYLRRRGDHLTDDVTVDFLAVHDQAIGAAGDFLGCRFPADARYRAVVAGHARSVFAHLAGRGVTGHVGVDFIAVERHGALTVNATEVNLRQTGSTHPHRMVRTIHGGTWTPEGTLVDAAGDEVFYTGTDGLVSPRWVGVSSGSLPRALGSAPRVRFDRRTGRGAVPHLWTSLEPHGKVGATFVGGSAAECDRLESDFVSLLDGLP